MEELFARTASPKSEVRRCGKCGESAVICYQAWSHSFNRVATQVITRECRCQSCGAFSTLRDPKAIRNLKIAGWVMVWMIIPPLVIFSVTRAYRAAWEKNPLVPDAPYPVIRYRSGPADRRCGGCGQPVQLTKTTKHRHNGIPTGTTYVFVCAGCKKSFTTESTGGIVLNLVLGVSFALGGGLMLIAGSDSPWAAAICLVMGLGCLYLAGRRILAARRNPEIETPHLLA